MCAVVEVSRLPQNEMGRTQEMCGCERVTQRSVCCAILICINYEMNSLAK